MADVRTVKRYAELVKRKRKLDAEVKKIKKQLADLEEPVLGYFGDQCIEQQRFDGVTLSVRRELWAGHNGDVDAACQALVEAGYGDLVGRRFNTSQLSAVVREWDRAGEEIPDGLREHIKVSEVFKISARVNG